MLRFRLLVLILAVGLLAPLGVHAQEDRLEDPPDAETVQRDLLHSDREQGSGPAAKDCDALFDERQERLRSLSASFDEDKQRLKEERLKAAAEAKSEREREAWTAAYEDALDALTREHRDSLREVHEAYATRCQPDPGPTTASASLYPVEGYCTDPALPTLLESRFERGMKQLDERRYRDHVVFEAQKAERREAFEARGDSTHDDRRAFALQQQHLDDAFDERLDALQRAARAELRATEYAYLEQLKQRCDPHGTNDPDTGPPSLQVLRLVRMECGLEAGRGPAAQESEGDLRRECQKRLDALWEARLQALDATPQIERFGRWALDLALDLALDQSLDGDEEGLDDLQGRYVDMKGQPQIGVIRDFAVGPTLFMERISTLDALPLHLERNDTGSLLQATGGGYRLEWTDNPTGLLRYHVPQGGALRVDLPEAASVQRSSSGIVIEIGDHKANLRASSDALLYDAEFHMLTLTGEGLFWVPQGGDNLVLPGAANQYRSVIMQAVEDRRLGAEVTLTAAGKGGPHHETLIFEDLELEVVAEPENRRVSVTVASESLHQGRAFVMNIDEQLLDPRGRLKVEYFDVDPETGAETPVEIMQAASLTGLLTKSSSGAPVYWTVMGGDGLQWIVFVPDWSEHKFTITSEDHAVRFEVPVTPIMMSVIVAGVGLFVRITRRFS